MSERPDLDFGYRLGQNACNRYVYNPHVPGYYEDLRPREMTAGDLGLPEFDMNAALARANALYRNMPISDAPYAFWLGADA